jgi:hypothetical protein
LQASSQQHYPQRKIRGGACKVKGRGTAKAKQFGYYYKSQQAWMKSLVQVAAA